MRAAILLLFLAHVALASPSSKRVGLDAVVSGFKLGSVAVPDFLNPEKQAKVTFGDLRKERPTVIRLPSADTRPIRGPSSGSGSGPPRASTGLPAKGARELWKGRTEPASASGLPRPTSQPTGSPASVPKPSSLRDAKSSPPSSTAGSVSADEYHDILMDFKTIVGSVTKELRHNPIPKKTEWEFMALERSVEKAAFQKLQSATKHLNAAQEQAMGFLLGTGANNEMNAFVAYITGLAYFLRDMELAQMALAKAGKASAARILFTNLKSKREKFESGLISSVPDIADYLKLLPKLMWDTFGIRVRHGGPLEQLVDQLNVKAGWV